MVAFFFVGCKEEVSNSTFSEDAVVSNFVDDKTKENEELISGESEDVEEKSPTAETDNSDKIVKEEPEEPKTLEQRAVLVFDFLCNNVPNFKRNVQETYFSYGVSNIVQKANTTKKSTIESLVVQLEDAIKNEESLLQETIGFSTGNAKLVEDFDSALYSVWHALLVSGR